MIHRFEQFSSAVAICYKCIQKIERDQMARYGLKGPHVQCLMTLSRYPEGLTAAELCDHCEKDKAAISRAVAELETEGLLLRERAYRAPLKLTEQGREMAHKLTELTTRAVEQAGKGLTEENREIFYAALDLIANNLQRISEDGIFDES